MSIIYLLVLNNMCANLAYFIRVLKYTLKCMCRFILYMYMCTIICIHNEEKLRNFLKFGNLENSVQKIGYFFVFRNPFVEKYAG